MKIIRISQWIVIFLSIHLTLSAQNAGKKDHIKSTIILEEKHDALIRKQYKESETYFDLRGNVIESITYKQGKIKKHFKYLYDEQDNKIKEEEYDPSGRLMEYSEYKYEDGLRIEKTVFDPNNKIILRKTYQYTKY